MKKILFISTIVAIVFASCGGSGSKADTSAVDSSKMNDASYSLSTESTLGWKGTKPTGSHTGALKIESGSVVVENGLAKSGEFVIDMKSITCTDLVDTVEAGKLLGHLSSPDFFNTDSFATSKFVIKSHANGELKGDLTIKGITNEITIPGNFTFENGTALFASNFKIDRTKWNIKYKSKTIFNDLGDKFIDDEIEFTLNLKATKQ